MERNAFTNIVQQRTRASVIENSSFTYIFRDSGHDDYKFRRMTRPNGHNTDTQTTPNNI